MARQKWPGIDTVLAVVCPMINDVVGESRIVATVVHFPTIGKEEEIVPDIIPARPIVRVKAL
jgi:hypothetical protein